MSAPLITQHLSAGYRKQLIIQDVNLTIPAQKTTIIIGANGSGKSTLLNTLARLLPTYNGKIWLDGQAMEQLPTRHIAKKLGLLAQSATVPEGLSVWELVARGRYPWQGLLQQWSPKDQQAVEEALHLTGITELAQQPVAALSGGQRQRCWIAMTLAQQTPYILLDEPTTYLDIRYQVEILTLLRELTQNQGKTVVMVLHDLNFALHYADKLVLMKQGKIIAELDDTTQCTPALIEETFDIKARFFRDPLTNKPVVMPELPRDKP